MKKITQNEFLLVNNYKRLFDRSCKMDIININSGNTFEHELMKCYLAIALAKDGKHFLTEASFTFNGKKGRADLVDLSTGKITEILESEKDESLEKKRIYYPLPLRAIRARKLIQIGDKQ